MDYNLEKILSNTRQFNFNQHIILHISYQDIALKELDLINVIILTIIYCYLFIEIRDKKTVKLLCFGKKIKTKILLHNSFLSIGDVLKYLYAHEFITREIFLIEKSPNHSAKVQSLIYFNSKIQEFQIAKLKFYSNKGIPH